MKIDDAIIEVEMGDDGEGPSTKEPTVEVEALDVEVEEYTSENESTPIKSRVETKSMSRTASPLTPLEMKECPLQRNHHHEWLKTIWKVTLLGF